ncbi:hypothetical protein PSH58_15540 [Pseudomonas hefeiensis]|uniref:Uncharacterized protein n=1 Tax=Pseudomonas hefeiensis TaxID=2738125 RepID=A0ABY9G3V5_9PSED|nr:MULTISPECIES: hypothetical protein [unclassified Pseudomonas]WLH10320.1 hypothetical protein PSH57_15520 [Pseudomonas sp. FP205]WLH93396.1 hypothetical protein PSH58_15540 [Pseudomonas sp. FP53]WLI37684.1 hypothetical protein PSH74_15470 [Pseudomonas sp. FP821]
MPKTAKEYLDTQLSEKPESERDTGSPYIFAILDFQEIEPGDVTLGMKNEIIALAIPRLQKAYPWASAILPDQMGINSGGWLMHFKVIR